MTILFQILILMYSYCQSFSWSPPITIIPKNQNVTLRSTLDYIMYSSYNKHLKLFITFLVKVLFSLTLPSRHFASHSLLQQKKKRCWHLQGIAMLPNYLI